MRRYGSFGLQLARYARGEDSRKVEARGAVKSISVETTFDEDMAEPAALNEMLDRLCLRVSQRLAQRALAGRTVVLKLKSQDFRTRTRSVTLPAPTGRADAIAAAGRRLLQREADGTRYRLLGIGVAKLCAVGKANLPDMLDPTVGDGTGVRTIEGQQSGFADNATSRSWPLIAKSP